MDFGPHLRQLFAVRAAAATYTPPSGPAVSCRAVRLGGGQPIQLGPVRIIVDRTFFHVRRAEIAAPAPGGTITIGADSFTIEAVQPAERDAEQLLWTLEASWGALVAYRSITGAGTSQNPPQGALFSIAANALAGATSVAIKAGFAVGKLLAGDRLTVAGDATIYTVTGAGSQASGNQFAAVPITPALAANALAGAAVTFDFARDYDVRAAVAGYQANEIMGGVQVGDRRLVVIQAALDAAGMDAPKAGDKVFLESRQLAVISATAIYRGATPYVWDIQARG